MIFELGANEPSAFSVIAPVMPVAVSTASPGARMRASTSRTRTVVFDEASTVNVHGPLADTLPAGVAPLTAEASRTHHHRPG